jgi:demethoxyubiquinone hydroxylase (CLK1/Coq7/Cat5 family)
MDKHYHRQHLVKILQNAYSGELAAAYAYRGHWKSLKNAAEINRIKQIEDEEWIHREKVGRLLASLGSRPLKRREVKMWLIGRSVGIACHVTGWFLPMYFAGRLETANVEEYATAARHAAELGLPEFESELRVMAAVEKEHEIFFMSVVANHRLLPYMRAIFKWGPVEPSKAQKAESGI